MLNAHRSVFILRSPTYVGLPFPLLPPSSHSSDAKEMAVCLICMDVRRDFTSHVANVCLPRFTGPDVVFWGTAKEGNVFVRKVGLTFGV